MKSHKKTQSYYLTTLKTAIWNISPSASVLLQPAFSGYYTLGLGFTGDTHVFFIFFIFMDYCQ